MRRLSIKKKNFKGIKELKSKTETFVELRNYLDHVPVIETHEHYIGKIEPIEDVLSFISNNYYLNDMISSSIIGRISFEKELGKILDLNIPFDERYELFEKVYDRSKETAYAKGMIKGLKECWGIDDINKSTILELQDKFKERDKDFYTSLMDKYKIAAKIVNISNLPDFHKLIKGTTKDYSKLCRFAFPLPVFHNIHRAKDIYALEEYFNRRVSCLDDYIEGFEDYLKECIEFGIICLKDQSAYTRIINYTCPSRFEAEKVFNTIINNPRDIVGDDIARTLDDWLFHFFLKLARKYGLPVQIHTGHVNGMRNEISKTNAVHLTSIFQQYPGVLFDIFHGNWPYMGELLFLGKNYPNVWIDLCWVQSIDPIYSIELMKRALVTIPHTKIMVFGGDERQPEWTIGDLEQARDNVACALSEMIESGWITMKAAMNLTVDWFFNNPNEFFDL